MFELNPLGNPDALWQHTLMLVVAAVLGYIIGYLASKQTEQDLEERLAALDLDLNDCQTKKQVLKKTPVQFAGATVTHRKDDLKVVEGIGPQIESLLNESGIWSFEQLKNTSSERLIEVLTGAGRGYQMHDPATWPKQAQLAFENKWDELKAWQDELNGGRQE